MFYVLINTKHDIRNSKKQLKTLNCMVTHGSMWEKDAEIFIVKVGKL